MDPSKEKTKTTASWSPVCASSPVRFTSAWPKFAVRVLAAVADVEK